MAQWSSGMIVASGLHFCKIGLDAVGIRRCDRPRVQIPVEPLPFGLSGFGGHVSVQSSTRDLVNDR